MRDSKKHDAVASNTNCFINKRTFYSFELENSYATSHISTVEISTHNSF